MNRFRGLLQQVLAEYELLHRQLHVEDFEVQGSGIEVQPPVAPKMLFSEEPPPPSTPLPGLLVRHEDLPGEPENARPLPGSIVTDDLEDHVQELAIIHEDANIEPRPMPMSVLPSHAPQQEFLPQRHGDSYQDDEFEESHSFCKPLAMINMDPVASGALHDPAKLKETVQSVLQGQPDTPRPLGKMLTKVGTTEFNASFGKMLTRAGTDLSAAGFGKMLSKVGTREFHVDSWNKITAMGSMENIPTMSVGQIVEAITSAEFEKPTVSIGSIMRRINLVDLRESGCMASIAKSKTFDSLVIAMVILNSIWIAIDAEFNQAGGTLSADPIFLAMENFFCAIFAIEIIIRYASFKTRMAALRDPCFVWDTVLVTLTIIDTWVMLLVTALMEDGRGPGANASLLRLLRVSRLFRISRIVRVIPELSFMVKALFEAGRVVACTIFLLFGILYVFGIALKQLGENTNMGQKFFSTVPHAIFTLFTQGALLDGITDLLKEVYEDSLLCAMLVFIVVAVAALTLMNMLVGVICEVMTAVSQTEKATLAAKRAKEQIQLALKELDGDQDKHISKDEFVHILCNLKASKALQGAGVDVVRLVDFADYFFQSDKHGESFEHKWSLNDFMEEVMRVPGMNTATVRDISELRKIIHSESTQQNATLRQIQENVMVLAKNQIKLEQVLMNRKSLSRARTFKSTSEELHREHGRRSSTGSESPRKFGPDKSGSSLSTS